MRKFVSTVIWLALVAVFAVFLVANRQLVAISLDPVNVADPAVATPRLFLWIWLILFLLVGVFMGAFGMWLSGGEKRKRARADRELVKSLKRENEILAARSTGEPPTLKVEKTTQEIVTTG
jgi:hypothetical protein